MTGDIINIRYETGKNLLPYSPLFFAIVDDANYTTYIEDSLDAVLLHGEYVVSEGSGQQTENWNWTVPYESNWHFIFNFRETYREDFYVQLTRYWTGTDYVETTDFREAVRPLLPYYCSYLGIALIIIGVIVLLYSRLINSQRCHRFH